MLTNANAPSETSAGSACLRALALYKNSTSSDPPSDSDLDLRPVEANLPTNKEILWSIFTGNRDTDISRHPLPPSDLVDSLVNLYFERFHPLTPILHRPSFERSLQEGKHLHDNAFKSTVFAVLAVASRFSDDPRALQDFGYVPPDQLHAFAPLQTDSERVTCDNPSYISVDGISLVPRSSAGWAFAFVVSSKQTLLSAASNFNDLQSSLLLCHYISLAFGLGKAWTVLGFFVRKAQGLGLHRKGSYNPGTSFLEQEYVQEYPLAGLGSLKVREQTSKEALVELLSARSGMSSMGNSNQPSSISTSLCLPV